MEYLPSKKLGHARLTPKYSEPLENTVIIALKAEKEKNISCNVVCELPLTLEEIKMKAETDEFITKMKIKQIMRSEETNTKKICVDNFEFVFDMR